MHVIYRFGMFGMTVLTLGLAAGGMVAHAAGENIADGAYAAQLTKLVGVLKEHGHDISAFLEDPEFVLYERSHQEIHT